jgi:hypothetical protein
MQAVAPSLQTQLGTLAKEFQLPTSIQDQIINEFVPLCTEAGRIAREAQSVIVTSPDQTEQIERSGKYRKQIGSVRVLVEKTRKRLKDDYLRPGQFIDKSARTITEMIEPHEKRLAEQEKIVERMQQEAEAKLATERSHILLGFGMDPHSYPMPIGKIPQQQFDDLAAGAKRRQEEAQKAEADRLAMERERAQENQRLAEENAKIKAEHDAAVERERQANLDKLKAEQETARLTAEAKKKETDAKLAAARAARAPDKEKLLAFAQAIATLKCADLKSDEAKTVCGECYIDLASVVYQLKSKIEKL